MHYLYFVGLGPPISFKAGQLKATKDALENLNSNKSNQNISFVNFTTSKAVKFSDFDHQLARITSLSFIAHKWFYLMIYNSWDRWNWSVVAYIKMHGWGLKFPSGALLIGETALVHSDDGKPVGNYQRELHIPEEYGPDGPRMAFYTVKAYEPAIITMPDDVLFDFGSYKIKPEAEKSLHEIAFMLNSRIKQRVEIHGHTDSKGDEKYNYTLSNNRALAIKIWFISNKVLQAQGFFVKPYGETKPIEPNKKKDGSDNPEGQKANRRVEIIFSRHRPKR
jgi:outer membrane protein OmpA-like peptidoglycan-associated protein